MKKHSKRRMPIPQHEFGFTAEVFRLFSEEGLDGDRLSRELVAARDARQASATAQTKLFEAATKKSCS